MESTEFRPAPLRRVALRVIAGRPVSERERIEFENRWADRCAVVIFAAFALVGVWVLASFLLSLERITP